MNFGILRSRKRLLVLLAAFAIVSILYAIRLFYLQVFPDPKISTQSIEPIDGVKIPITASEAKFMTETKCFWSKMPPVIAFMLGQKISLIMRRPQNPCGFFGFGTREGIGKYFQYRKQFGAYQDKSGQ